MNKNRFSKLDIIEVVSIFIFTFIVKLLFDRVQVSGMFYSGFDQSIFAYIGQAWSDGLIPYKDLFDHKGPLLFLIYAIASSISQGITGMMIVSLINHALVLLLTLRISRLIIPQTSNIVHYSIVVIANFFFLTTREVVGLSENFSLLFIFVPLYLCIRFISKNKDVSQHPTLYSVIYGFCFASIAMIRVNNASINVGIVIGFIILLLLNKNYVALLKNAGAFLLGCSLVVVPFIIYFHANQALEDMIYASYTFNMSYKYSSHSTISIGNILKLIPCVYLAILTLIYDRSFNTRFSFFIIPSSIICFFAFIDSANYLHYFVNVMPFYALSLIISYKLIKSNKAICTTVIAFALIIPYYGGIVSTLGIPYKQIIQNGLREQQFAQTKMIQEKILSIIPKEDYANVHSYAGFNKFTSEMLTKNRIYTKGKYFVLNDFHSKIDEKVKNELDNYYSSTDVKWIIANISLLDQSESLQQKLKEYETVYSEGEIVLFKRVAM